MSNNNNKNETDAGVVNRFANQFAALAISSDSECSDSSNSTISTNSNNQRKSQSSCSDSCPNSTVNERSDKTNESTSTGATSTTGTIEKRDKFSPKIARPIAQEGKEKEFETWLGKYDQSLFEYDGLNENNSSTEVKQVIDRIEAAAEQLQYHGQTSVVWNKNVFQRLLKMEELSNQP